MIDYRRREIVDRAIKILTSLPAAYELNQAKPGNLKLAESIA